MNDFSYSTKDMRGDTPDMNLIGRKLRHHKREKVYTIIGFVWLGHIDQWGFLHVSDGPVICRPLSHIIPDRYAYV